MRIIATLLVIATLAYTMPATAQQERRGFSIEQVELINLAQDYLAKVRTLKANFIQVNPRPSMISSGEILLSKPGKLKMSYSKPYKIDYYITGDRLLQYDHDLDEVARGSAPDNPLKILLYDKISLTNNELMNVTHVVDMGQTFNIFMVNRTDNIRDVTGLILKFRKKPLQLTGVERVDHESNKVETNFTAVTINENIDDSAFVFKRPRKAYPTTK